jgi:hypothetical protein
LTQSDANSIVIFDKTNMTMLELSESEVSRRWIRPKSRAMLCVSQTLLDRSRDGALDAIAWLRKRIIDHRTIAAFELE